MFHSWHVSISEIKTSIIKSDLSNNILLFCIIRYILAEKRGSAVDGAIAAMACVGVMSLQSGGVGGGHFMTIYDT